MQIVTTRLILREYAAGDLGALLAHQTDPRAREFYGPDDALPSMVPDLLRTFLEWAREEPRRNWQLAIARREAPRRLIGSCGLRQAGLKSGYADLGLELDPDTWGRGYGMEAATAMIEFGFRELGVVSIRGETVSANERVARLLARMAFRFVGTREGPAWMRDRGWTYAEWELPRSDWAGSSDSRATDAASRSVTEHTE